MRTLDFKEFTGGGRWADLCVEVCAWVNGNVLPENIVSISASEGGKTFLDTQGTIIVWYRR